MIAKITLQVALLISLLTISATAQTGIPVSSMASCDNSVLNFMSTYGIPGATFALANDGKLIYLRGFGNANLTGTEPVQPYHLFRIASLSKPITSISIMKLMEQGRLSLSDKAFGPGGILQNHPVFASATITDNRIFSITVQQLLEHTAGWNRNINCFPNPTLPYNYQVQGCDPISAPLYVAQQTNSANPVSKDYLIKFLLEKGLDFNPGTAYAYSNIGYSILGKIIETKTGTTYEQFVRDSVLAPLGICDIRLGKNLLSNKLEREVEYTGNGYTTLSAYGTGNQVPWEYGGFNLEAMDSHGGWIATASDLVKLLVAVDGFSTKPDILSNATITTMTTPSAVNSNGAKGWSVNAANNWWHTGLLEGTASFMARTNSGYTWAIILNKSEMGAISNNFWQDLDQLPWNCIANTPNFPSHDLMLTPAANASGVTFSNITSNSVTVNWAPGTGNNRLLVASEGTEVNAFPLNGTTYTANASFGVGQVLSNNNYVVYKGPLNSTTITNLKPNTNYFFKIFEFNATNLTGNYPLYKLCNSEQKFVKTLISPTSIQEVSSTEVSVLPNPTAGKLTLSFPTEVVNASLRIFNANGQLVQRVYDLSGTSYTVDLSKQANGLYYLELVTKSARHQVKVIKN